VRVLLDTHALLWWLAGDEQLTARARRAITDPRHELYVSAVSAWEVLTKARLGKLPSLGALGVDFEGTIALHGFRALPITMAHAEGAGRLAISHRDPFDRMLLVQARDERMALVSGDPVFDGKGIRRIW
jgi:PIN domain nuclease of toxin-antitoxin system